LPRHFPRFQAHFNRIYVCRVAETCDGAGFSPEQARQGAGGPPGCWCKYELDGEWTADSAGGCFNFPSWRTNPQYELVVGKETNAFFILMQPDPRMDKGKLIVKGEGDEGGPKYDHKIGMYVMKGHEQFSRKVIFDSEEIEGDDVLDSTPYMEYREVRRLHVSPTATVTASTTLASAAFSGSSIVAACQRHRFCHLPPPPHLLGALQHDGRGGRAQAW